MKGKIAIEPALSNVGQYLAGKGYQVETINQSDLSACTAIVVTGLSTNMLNVQDTETKAVVINADGLTPEEVAKRIDGIQAT